jgi:hypothetical protein
MTGRDAMMAADPTSSSKLVASVDEAASRLLADPRVKARVAELLVPSVERVEVTIQSLIDTFVAQGTFDPVVFDGVGSLAELKAKVDEPTRRMRVKGWKYDRQGRFLLELIDKDTALDRLARHLSFYRDVLKVEVLDYATLLGHAEAQTGELIEGTTNP